MKLHLRISGSTYRHACGLRNEEPLEGRKPYIELRSHDGHVSVSNAWASFVSPFSIPLASLKEADLHYKGTPLEICATCLKKAKSTCLGQP